MSHENSQPRTGDLPSPQAITSPTQALLIQGDQALADRLGVSLSTIRTWRAKRLIPFVSTGHRSISYRLPSVLAAIERLEVRPQSETPNRKR
jgi:hypothetical protein